MKRFIITIAAIPFALGAVRPAAASFIYTINADSGLYASSSGEVRFSEPTILTSDTTVSTFTTNTVTVFGSPLTSVFLEPAVGFGHIQLSSSTGSAGVCCVPFTSVGSYEQQLGLVISSDIGGAAPEPSAPWLLGAGLGVLALTQIRRKSPQSTSVARH